MTGAPRPLAPDPAAILDRPPPPADRRVTYGDHPSQFGDLRLPADDRGLPADAPVRRAPLAILLHGGYWRARYGLGYFGHVAAALVADGFATWNLEYRRVGEPGGGWPGTFEDVRAGVAVGLALHRDHPIDRDRTVLIGHSAGGHLALWAVADLPPNAGARDGLSVLALAPVADLGEAWARRLSDNAVEGLLGGGPEDVPLRYAEACPSRRLPPSVHVCVVHGTADAAVPFDLGEAFVKRAQAAGGDVTLVALEGVGHFEPVDPESMAFATVRRVTRDLVGLA